MAGAPIQAKQPDFSVEVKDTVVKVTFANGKVVIRDAKDKYLISKTIYDILMKEYQRTKNDKKIEKLKLSGFDYLHGSWEKKT